MRSSHPLTRALAGLVALAAAWPHPWGLTLGPAREASLRPLGPGWYRLPGWRLTNPSARWEEATIVVLGPRSPGVRLVVLPRRLTLGPRRRARILAGLRVSRAARPGRYRYRIIARVSVPGRRGIRMRLEAQVRLDLWVGDGGSAAAHS